GPASRVRVTAKFDLTLFLVERDHGLTGTAEFSAELFDRSTIERLVTALRVVLEQMAVAPERHLSELSLLTLPERTRLLDEWAGDGGTVPDVPGVHDRVTAPSEATAVVAGDTALSYGDLRARAGRLAGHLRSLGVVPDTVVGVCLPRGVDLAVALLAIWK